jgi:hypothetical protein
MTTGKTLPLEFAELEPLVGQWALTNEKDRVHKLLSLSIQELRQFYDAMFPHAESIVRYLEQYDPKKLPADAKTLFHLFVTFIETAYPIELKWTITDIDDSFELNRLEFGEASSKSPI